MGLIAWERWDAGATYTVSKHSHRTSTPMSLRCSKQKETQTVVNRM